MVLKLDWVLRNELAIGKPPLNEQDILFLKENAIVTIISLCFKSEYKPPKEICSSFNYYNYPIPDHRKKESLKVEEILFVLNCIKENIRNGPIYIHCFAAMERSPLICIAWLMREKGYSLQVALDYLMQVHFGTSPLPNQLNLLNDERFKIKKR